MIKNLNFSKRKRLLLPKEFKSVFDSPLCNPRSKYFRVLAKPNNLNTSRLGITVAKRRVAKAVYRNKIKRTLRESFRINQHKLKCLDIVIIFTGTSAWTVDLLRACIDKQWRSLMLDASNC